MIAPDASVYVLALAIGDLRPLEAETVLHFKTSLALGAEPFTGILFAVRNLKIASTSAEEAPLPTHLALVAISADAAIQVRTDTVRVGEVES